MAYRYFRHMCLHSGVILLVVMSVVHRAHAQSGKDAYTYRLHNVNVTLPDGLQRDGDGAFFPGFFISAKTSTLDAALQAARLQKQGDTAHDPCSTLYAFEQLAPGQQVTALRLTALNPSVDGQRLWWVMPQTSADTPQQAAACTVSPDEPWTLFTKGLAHVSFVSPILLGHGAPIVWVNLRHAASELTDEWTQDEVPNEPSDPPGAARTCSPTSDRPVRLLSNADVAQSVVWHSAVQQKRLALTFDACSTYNVAAFNPAVIAALEAEDVPATLFVGGHWAEMHPQELVSLAQNPLFEIGNHTYSHPHMRDLAPWQQAQELRWTQALIYSMTGVTPTMFRPPYGEVDDAMLREVARAGLTTVQYDLPAGDADVHVSPQKLTQWVVGKARAGSIVIMHMNRPKNHTAEALPMIVRELRAKGYTFCQMTDLLYGDGSRCR